MLGYHIHIENNHTMMQSTITVKVPPQEPSPKESSPNLTSVSKVVKNGHRP